MKNKINLPAFFLGGFFGLLILSFLSFLFFEKKYKDRAYPGVKIANIDFGGKRDTEIEAFWQRQSLPFENVKVSFVFEEKIATLSGSQLKLGYDSKLCGQQAVLFARSGNFLSDFYQKWQAQKRGVNFSPVIKFESSVLDDFLNKQAEEIDIPAQDALFNFSSGRVTAFKLSSTGRALNKKEAEKLFNYFLPLAIEKKEFNLIITLPVYEVKPKVAIEEVNNLGIKELIGRGASRFTGSIQNRIDNITLAAKTLNGVLISPGEEFSFNKALGDVSSKTGYKPAYVIKERRTVLDDGGGVCQVSTTLFRAALNTGLPITERRAHAYRVGYYEQGPPGVGFDATVYPPSPDLKFKNDFESYLLIQSFVNYQTSTLTFELYGTADGRSVEITKPIIKNQVPALPDLYLDEPTLPKDQVKQIDWSAWGADVSFIRTVVRNGETIISETISSHYQPWQAIYLRGTREGN